MTERALKSRKLFTIFLPLNYRPLYFFDSSLWITSPRHRFSFTPSLCVAYHMRKVGCGQLTRLGEMLVPEAELVRDFGQGTSQSLGRV